MGTTAEKLSYLNTTKTKIKEALNLGGANITNETFRQYVDKIKDRYLYYMLNGTQVVWNNWNKVSGTGTSLTLNNTEEAPMSLVYKGNTSQNGTPTPSSPVNVDVVSGDNSIEVVGKNLLTLTDKEQTTHASGITYKVENNVFTLSGTNTSSSSYSLTAWIDGQVQTYLNKILEKGKTFTLSSNNDLAGLYFQINYFKEGATGQSALVNLGNFNSKITFTVPQDFNRTGNVFLGVYGNATTINGSFSLQLEYGNNKTDFVSYQTLTSYPISLGVENLLPVSTLATQLKNGIIFTNNQDGSYSFNGTATAYTTFVISNSLSFNGNYTYVLKDTATTGLQMYLQRTGGIGVGGSQTHVTLNDNIKIMLIGIDNGTTLNNVVIRPYVYSGNYDSSKTYTPYGKYIELCKIGTYQDKIDKSTGKNLFDKDTETIGKTITLATGVVDTTANDRNTSNYIYVKQNTNYICSTTMTRYAYYDKNKTFISSATSQHSITTPNNAYYLRFSYDNTLTNVMLNEGTTALPYEPYGTGWYLKKEIGKVVLNGSENWYLGTRQDGTTKYFQINPATMINTNNTSVSNEYSNYFKIGNPYNNSTEDIIWAFKSGNNNIIRLGFKEPATITTAEDFKTWLSTHNTDLYYPLATPTYETITDTTLLSQLEALKKSYESVTNISQVNDGLSFELDVSALEVMN